jgi:hypothetical protein
MVLVVSALAGCGGSASSHTASSEAAVGASFAARALAVCKSALAEKHAWKPFPVSDFDPTDPDPEALPTVATWLDGEVAPTFGDWHDRLAALGHPPSAKDTWNRLLAIVAEIGQGNEQEIRAARAGDSDAFKAASQTLQDAQPHLVHAANAAGVSACADVHAA